MFVIVTYDIVEARSLNRIRKILRKYLTWTQNSVFEGDITDGKLHKCISEIENIIDNSEDSIYVYEIKILIQLKRNVMVLISILMKCLYRFAVSDIYAKIGVNSWNIRD
ncbi:CRISPR-associated endonuclease Cas2 [Clostridioides sp. ZZV14-6345]|uniref:CRISPR-associated endonuclease Cas2 n=1 Tax=Clostridioides sp. ZZV14-6345 TaxID=2811496 RepID=UPI0039BC859B